MAKISFVMGCRIDGNENSKMKKFIESFYDNAFDPNSFEALVKFDDDDEGAINFIKSIENERYAKNVKHIITPRGRGYADLHEAYNSLMKITDSESLIYWVLSDDCETLCKNWDKIILDEINKFPDGIFVMHPGPLARYEKMSPLECLEKSDPYPIWSRKWISTLEGFGYTFSSDGWSALLERELILKHGLDRRIFLPMLNIKRHTTAEDYSGSERFNTVRKEAIDKMLSNEMKKVIDQKIASLHKVIIENGSSSKLNETIHKLKNKVWANKYIKKINKKLRKMRQI